MSRYERWGTRDMTFSAWHRTLPDWCTAIDLDFLEYCQRCREPLALIELAQDVGQGFKATAVMEALSRRSGVPSFLILYKKDKGSLGECRMARIWPDRTRLYKRTAEQVGESLKRIHRACANCQEKAKKP